MNSIKMLHKLGQSIWYDNIDRRLLFDGTLAGMIADGKIRGITSNPSILNKAISSSSIYDEDIVLYARKGLGKEAIYESLAISDIQTACDLFLPLYEESHGGDGYVSLEVSPYLAHDTQGTLDDAVRLWDLVGRPNLMVKIPATKAGLPAFTSAIAQGINVNVTLIFAVERYQLVMEAYLKGLEYRYEAGKDLNNVASVASFFVSRIDTLVDDRLVTIANQDPDKANPAKALRGKIAVANAKLAYERFMDVINKKRFRVLENQGARFQRPLWASTSTKNPEYSDTKYIDELIGPDTINTIPPKTLENFEDHGTVDLTLEKDLDEAKNALDRLKSLGISMTEVTEKLEKQGLKAFADAYTDLLGSIETQRVANV